MKKLLIIKTGSTFPSIKKEYGDFDDFIINMLDINNESIIVADVKIKQSLPELRYLSGIIITGSHSMVTDYEDWSVDLTNWLKELKHKTIPTIGICYGHQLLAEAFGGKVAFHPKGKEFGTKKIELTDSSKNDMLFKKMPAEFLGHTAHSQSIRTLSENSVVLAKNDFENFHAVLFHDKIWGVQFHPEFNAGITRMYIEEMKDSLINEGTDIELLIKNVSENEYGKLLFHRFLEII